MFLVIDRYWAKDDVPFLYDFWENLKQIYLKMLVSL